MIGSVLLAFLAASATSAEASAAAPVAAPPAVKEKKICVTQDAVTGSITPKRVCKTKAEWDALMGRTTAQQQPAGSPQSPSAPAAGK
jgi:hypothetical protein